MQYSCNVSELKNGLAYQTCQFQASGAEHIDGLLVLVRKPEKNII